VLALAVVAAAGWYGPLRYTTRPSLTGLPVAQARTTAISDGFAVQTADTFSDTVPKGDVAAVSPSRPWLRRGSQLRLLVSRGPEMHRVPAVAGTSLDDARRALQQARLRPGAVSSDWSDSAAKGLVAGTTPAAGVEVRHDTVVAIVLSKGPKPVAVPDLTGKAQTDALGALTALRLVADVTTDYSTTVAKDSVIRQGTKAGTSVLPGTHVPLVVSLGPPLVPVPHVVGKRISSAVAELERAGFTVKVSGLRVLGLVLFERPGGGSKRPLGSTVSLTTT
jgi:serine/threonine-protein kinase